MKIALCLFGILGGKSGKDGQGGILSPKQGFNSFKSLFLDDYNVDIFCHSWTKSHEKEIIEAYNPVKHLIEEQQDFSHLNLEDYNFKNLRDLINAPGNPHIYETYRKRGMDDVKFLDFYRNLMKNSNSRWCSTYKVINLLEQHENDNNITYDYVILSRYDVFFRTGKLKFENLNKDDFYIFPYRESNPKYTDAYPDMVVLSDSDKMKKFGKLYEDIFSLPIRPTIATKTHLDNLNFNINYLNYNYDLIRRI